MEDIGAREAGSRGGGGECRLRTVEAAENLGLDQMRRSRSLFSNFIDTRLPIKDRCAMTFAR